MVTIYLIIGLIISVFLFINVEIEKEFFSKKMGVDSFIDFIGNVKIVGAFIILIIFWPLALIKIIIDNL